MRKLITSVGQGYDESYVGTVVDTKSKEIVAYPESHTYGRERPRYAAKLFCYRICVEFPDIEPITYVFYGADLPAAFMATGLGNKYEEEWGDYRALIEQLREHPEMVYVCIVEHKAVAKDRVVKAVKAVLRQCASNH